MQIQINTDNHINGSEALAGRIEAMLEQHLGRFFPRLTRIEAHLSDSNADKGGGADKRCALEARMEHEDPIGASHDDEDMEKAVRGACDKMRAKLDTLIGKRRPY